MAVKKKTGKKYIYNFSQGKAEGNADMRELLGGKGANLAEMCNLGFPVPSGVTITTEACTEYRALPSDERQSFIKRLAKRALKQLKTLNKLHYMPLVSVRSGAQVSMAGMMDTILNVGITSGDLPQLFQVLGARTTLDSYRRLQQMFGETVLGLSAEAFNKSLNAVKEAQGVELDSELTEDSLMQVVKHYDSIFDLATGHKFDYDYETQLAMSIEAVFNSWDNDRAKVYRKHHGIPEDWGTAVNIQFMVFGNAHGLSGSGVMFSRDTSTGTNEPTGEFLMDAQGEDVVAGVRTPEPLSHLQTIDSLIYQDLIDLSKKLEQHYNDVQDIEFTIQDGKLFLLQTRHAKRTATAELKIASDFLESEDWDFCDLKDKVSAESFDHLSRFELELSDEHKLLASGMGTGGVASGQVVSTAVDGLALHSQGVDFVLWAEETTPNDLEAMLVAKAVVTATGGHTCHAAVVARSLNLPCVVGTGVKPDTKDYVTVDADNGHVYAGLVPAHAKPEPEFARTVIRYIADSTGHIMSGDVLDGCRYALSSKPTEVTESDSSLVLDVTELEVHLGGCDKDLLKVVGMEAGDYRNEVFKAELDSQPLGWVNELSKSGMLPKTLIAVSDDMEHQSTIVQYALKALGFKASGKIYKPEHLMTMPMGKVDKTALENELGTELYQYLTQKLVEDGKYPQDIKRVSTKSEILKELTGE